MYVNHIWNSASAKEAALKYLYISKYPPISVAQIQKQMRAEKELCFWR